MRATGIWEKTSRQNRDLALAISWSHLKQGLTMEDLAKKMSEIFDEKRGSYSADEASYARAFMDYIGRDAELGDDELE